MKIKTAILVASLALLPLKTVFAANYVVSDYCTKQSYLDTYSIEDCIVQCQKNNCDQAMSDGSSLCAYYCKGGSRLFKK